jgi:cell division protein FtsB
VKRARVAGLALLAGGVIFGFWGGEYSTLDWWTLRQQVRGETAAIARLDAAVDSLAGYAQLVERDSAMQERVAREKFGMIREGEIVFRFEEAPP